MNEAINLFTDTDRAEGMRRRDKAVETVQAHAKPSFLTDALEAITALAYGRKTFTSDDVWPLMTATTHEPRAMGAAFKEAQKKGLIVPTPAYQPSNRPECHRNPKRVWKSATRQYRTTQTEKLAA